MSFIYSPFEHPLLDIEYRPFGAGNAEFTPADLENVALWLDGSDTSTMTIGVSGLVEAWENKIIGQPIDVLTQATGHFRPTLGSHAGHSTVKFSSSSGTLLEKREWGGFTGNFGFVVLLYKSGITVTGTTSRIFGFGRYNSGQNRYWFGESFAGTPGSFQLSLLRSIGGSAQNFGPSDQISSTGPRQNELFASVCYGSSSTFSEMFSNQRVGRAVSTVNVSAWNNTSNPICAVGCHFNSGAPDSFFNGEICEIIWCTTIPSVGQQVALFNYLNSKWGCSLPTTMPNLSVDDLVAYKIGHWDSTDSDSITLTDSKISRWSNISTHIAKLPDLIQTDADRRPRVSGLSIGGMDTIAFSGVNSEYLVGESSIVPSLDGNDLMLACVVKTNAISGSPSYFEITSLATSHRFLLSSENNTRAYASANTATTSTIMSLVSGAIVTWPEVVTAASTTTSLRTMRSNYIGGNYSTVVFGTFSDLDLIQAGRNRVGTQSYVQGEIGEILVFKGKQFSGGEAEVVKNYLIDKWSLVP